MAMIPALAIQLLPLIPGLVNSALSIVRTITNHPDTPQAVKDQLDGIGSALDQVAAKVAAVDLG